MGWFSKPTKPEYPPNEVFPAIDLNRIGKELDLSAKGTRNGRINVPESSRPTLDSTENTIVGEVEKIRRLGLTKFGEQMQVYRERIGRIESIGTGIREAADTAETNFRAESVARRDRLEDMRRDFNEVRDELKYFQEKNKISRTVHGYKGALQWLAITSIILMVESALNGVFFAEAHEMGIAGGVMNALGISVVNIGVATIAGHFFREVNHIRIWRKIIGLLALSVGISIATVGNFCVGHFRDAAINSPFEQAFRVAFERLASGQYLMESLEAWLLAALGILIAAVAGWKAYAMTDPYPGYGRVGQKYVRKRQEWRDLQEETLDALTDTRDEATEELKRHRNDAQLDIDNAVAAYEGLISLQAGRTSFLRDCNAAADHLLTVYRDANRQARETTAPAYFSQSFRFPPEPDPEPPRRPDREAMTRFREMVDHAVERIHEECSKAISSFDNADVATSEVP